MVTKVLCKVLRPHQEQIQGLFGRLNMRTVEDREQTTNPGRMVRILVGIGSEEGHLTVDAFLGQSCVFSAIMYSQHVSNSFYGLLSD